jgi:hypothetical protein
VFSGGEAVVFIRRYRTMKQAHFEQAVRVVNQLQDPTCLNWISDGSGSKVTENAILVDVQAGEQSGKPVLRLTVQPVGSSSLRTVTWRLPAEVVGHVVRFRETILAVRQERQESRDYQEYREGQDGGRRALQTVPGFRLWASVWEGVLQEATSQDVAFWTSHKAPGRELTLYGWNKLGRVAQCQD